MKFTISRFGTDLEAQVSWAEQNVNLITEIIIIAANEIDDAGYEYSDRLLALNKPTTIIVGSIKQDNPNLKKFPNVIYWPTYWLTETFIRLSQPQNKKVNEPLCLFIDKPNDIKNFDKLYIIMNKAPKYHRALFMDLLYKEDMFKDGYLIYRELSAYKFKYWQQEVLLLDQKDSSQLFNQEIVPSEYNKAMFQIVPETHENFFFLTEKTSIPLFFEKPFVVVGCKNFHKHLSELGFKLYDELFDYSFDSIEDINTRYETLVKSIKTISINFDLNCLRNKLNFNKKVAINLATNIKNFPTVWNEIASNRNLHLAPNPFFTNMHIKNETV